MRGAIQTLSIFIMLREPLFDSSYVFLNYSKKIKLQEACTKLESRNCKVYMVCKIAGPTNYKTW